MTIGILTNVLCGASYLSAAQVQAIPHVPIGAQSGLVEILWSDDETASTQPVAQGVPKDAAAQLALSQTRVEACVRQLQSLDEQITLTIQKLEELDASSNGDARRSVALLAAHLASLEQDRNKVTRRHEVWLQLALEAGLQQQREQNRKAGEQLEVENELADRISAQSRIDLEDAGDPFVQEDLIKAAMERVRAEKARRQAEQEQTAKQAADAERDRAAKEITEANRREAQRPPIRVYVSTFIGKNKDAARSAQTLAETTINRIPFVGRRVQCIDAQSQPEVFVVGEVIGLEEKATEPAGERRGVRLTYISVSLKLTIKSMSGRLMGERVYQGASKQLERPRGDAKASLIEEAIRAAVTKFGSDMEFVELIRRPIAGGGTYGP